MSATFSRAELLDLSAEDLRALFDVVEGDSVMERARSLGLDPFNNAEDYKAVSAAVPELKAGTQPFSPPVVPGQPGVRPDLTPPVVSRPDPMDVAQVAVGDATDALGLPEPSPEAQATMEQMLEESRGSGKPFMAGTFALYADPSGAVVIVSETKDGGIRRDIIPRKAVKFALSLMGGGAKRNMLQKMIGLG